MRCTSEARLCLARIGNCDGILSDCHEFAEAMPCEQSILGTPQTEAHMRVRDSNYYLLDIKSQESHTDNQGRLVFDIGMYDGADTAYYLQTGHRVVAVEANPAMVSGANKRFQKEIEQGRLTVVHAALSDSDGQVTLYFVDRDLGSSTICPSRIAATSEAGSVSVKAITIARLFDAYGVPHYLKSDIEGADRYAILFLSKQRAPNFVSFEIGDDFFQLLEHLASIGYSRFRIINQITYDELSQVISLRRRVFMRLLRATGRYNETTVWVNGYCFTRGHSSGPAPKAQAKWDSFRTTVERWEKFCISHPTGSRYGWYDLHAML